MDVKIMTFKKAEERVRYAGEKIDRYAARTLINLLDPERINNGKAVSEDRFRRFIEHTNNFMKNEGIPEIYLIE